MSGNKNWSTSLAAAGSTHNKKWPALARQTTSDAPRAVTAVRGLPPGLLALGVSEGGWHARADPFLLWVEPAAARLID